MVAAQVEKTRSEAGHDCSKQDKNDDFHWVGRVVASAQYIVNKATKKPLPSWLPLVVGGLLVAQFAGLGAWQVSRGFEKRETAALFDADSSYVEYRNGMTVRPFQYLNATGVLLDDRQIVLDNIIINSRLGHYVLTPLDLGRGDPLLLVNRGWIEQKSFDDTSLVTPTGTVTLSGRAGSLPKAGYKMGESFAATDDWPKHAVYPSQSDVEAVLGGPVQPFVLLLSPDEEHGFYRHWVPTEFGPGKHFGYAVQWFAMGAVLAGLLVWNYRKRRFS